MKSTLILAALLLCVSARLQYVGVNEAGADFGTNGPFGGGTFPGTAGSTYEYPTDVSINYFVAKGMNLIRLPFMWERIQPTFNTSLNANELALLTDRVNYITQTKGIYVLLDVHNYCRYTLQSGVVLLGSTLPIGNFADLWSRLALQFSNNNKVFFGLMNEPHDIVTETWLAAANSAIRAIRNTGARNLITVPGNAYTGAHSWTQNYYGTANSVVLTGVVDPINNFIFEIHQYLDSDFSGTHAACASTNVGSQQLLAFTAWARSNGFKALLGEFGGSANNSICSAAITDMLTYMQSNSDVYVGWTWWAAGPLWPANYIYLLEPLNNGAIDQPQMAVLQPFITGTYTPSSQQNNPSSQINNPSSQQINNPTYGSVSQPGSAVKSKSSTIGIAPFVIVLLLSIALS